MSHVDEAQLHEHLDALERGRQTDSSSLVPSRPHSSEDQEIEQHLSECAECAALLEEVQLIRERASALLRDASLAHVSMPPFEEIQARAEARARKAPRRVFAMTRLAALGWAATIVLAVGVGWLARGSFNFGSQETEQLPQREIVALNEPVTDVSAEAEEDGTGAAAESAAFQVAAGRRDAVQRVEEDVAPTPADTERLEMAAAPPPEPQRTQPEAEPPVSVAEPEQPTVAKADPAADARAREAVAGVAVAQQEMIDREQPRADENAIALQIDDAFRLERWIAVDRAGAESHIGGDLMAVEGLPIDSIRVGEVGGQPAVVVVQRLPSGEPIEIVQWKQDDAGRQAEGWVSVGAVSADQAPVEQPEARAAKRTPGFLTSVIARQGFLLALRAPVSADSLATLAERIR